MKSKALSRNYRGLVVQVLFIGLTISAFSSHAVAYGQSFKSCESIFFVKSKVTQNKRTFLRLLKQDDFIELEDLIFPDMMEAVRAVRGIEPKELDRLNKHWSATYSGLIISSDIISVIVAARFLKIKPGEKFIDIGSGHGIPDLVFGALHPKLQVTGYDIVHPKVKHAQKSADRFGLDNVSFVHQDLSDPKFKLPSSDYYYFFNPVNEKVVRSLGKQIISHSKKKPVKVIIYGGASDLEIMQEMGFRKVSPKELEENYSIYILEYQADTKP